MAWLILIGTLGTLLITYVLWHSLVLRQNYTRALKIGLPILVVPIDVKNPIWPLLGENRYFYHFMTNLPFNLGYWVPYTRWSWPFTDKFKTHGKIGAAFIMVTAAETMIVLADPNAAAHVLSKGKEFEKPLELYQALNIFGRNIDTVGGDDWKRHRRLTAPSFNEKLSSVVWKEASRQGKQMLESWIGEENDGIRRTQHDLAALALNVLTHAGFGMTYSFKDDNGLPPGKHSMSYRNALSLVLENLILLAVFSRKVLQWSFFPSKWHEIGRAADEFQSYMEEMLKKEKAKFGEETESLSNNLMSSLVRASEAMARLNKTTGDMAHLDAMTDMARRGAMTDEEIFGNIFIYNLAGHETTANALSYSIVFLAAYPEVQEWISEEIRSVVNGSDLDNLDYEATFPKMKRCLAVMYETLRTHGSVNSIPKKVTIPSATLAIENKMYTIPYGTSIIVNNAALQQDPANWGPDATTWRPNRWILNETEEKLLEPAPGSFLAWADGPRVCPGKKIAQVEFVAVMMRLFLRHRVSPVLEGSPEYIRQKLIDMAEDSTILGPTLRMRQPDAIAMKWTEAK